MSNNARYFCDGPEGHFYCDDLEMARKLVNMIELYDDDWTITELPLNGFDELPPTVLTNPYTGQPRDYRDVESDPAGVLIVEPGAPMMATVPLKPTPAMVKAFCEAEGFYAGYDAMLAAAKQSDGNMTFNFTLQKATEDARKAVQFYYTYSDYEIDASIVTNLLDAIEKSNIPKS